MRTVVCFFVFLAVASAEKHCLKNEFECADGSACVQSDHTCDGTPDCKDHSDEVNCDHCDQEGFAMCKSGNVKCVVESWFCDGHPDCSDGSDEFGCGDDSVSASNSSVAVSSCSDKEFRCENGLCIPENMVCDDIKDCIDGSDEESGYCTSMPCKGSQFECSKDHKCIPIRWRCDGKEDCSDGQDEEGCNASSFECTAETFRCADNSTCIPLEKVCDGNKDCKDGSDDTDTCLESCKNHTCQERCAKSPTNLTGVCACGKGKKLGGDLRSCEDVDECRIEGTCSQLCENSDGGYHCSCIEGYTMRQVSAPGGGNSTRGACKATSPTPAVLFFAGRKEVGIINLDTMTESIVTRNREWAQQAVGIAYDAKRNRVYWTDSGHAHGGPCIVSSNMDGSGLYRFATSGIIIMPEGLAVDHVADNIYFAESIGNYIGVCSLQRKHCSRLHSEGVLQPREISLYPLEGLLFYTDWGANPKIGRVGMDGSNPRAIVQKGLHWPNGVSVDVALGRIFWSDAKLDLLESARLDGSDRRKLTVNFIRHPFSITVFEDNLFWSDWEIRQIQSCDKFTGKNQRVLLNRTDLSPMGIHVYHPVLEPVQENPCLKAKCTHICLLGFGGKDFACKCPDDMYLAKDRTTCKYKAISRLPAAASTKVSRERTSPTTTLSTTLQVRDEPTSTVAKADEGFVERVRHDKKLKVGLGVCVVILALVFLFGAYCVVASRRRKCQQSPVMRFKNPAFGYDDSSDGSEEAMDMMTEKSPSKSLKNPDEKLTSKLQMWPQIASSSGDSEAASKSEKSLQQKLGRLGMSALKSSQSRYYKL